MQNKKQLHVCAWVCVQYNHHNNTANQNFQTCKLDNILLLSTVYVHYNNMQSVIYNCSLLYKLISAKCKTYDIILQS
jgi:hypothetical protein